MSAVQAPPVRVVHAPASHFPAGVVVALVEGDGEAVMLVSEDASDADVCAASADVLADYLIGTPA